jgi:hypothetical protein
VVDSRKQIAFFIFWRMKKKNEITLFKIDILFLKLELEHSGVG